MKFGVDYNFIMLRKTTEAIFDICPQTWVTGPPRGWLPGGGGIEKIAEIVIENDGKWLLNVKRKTVSFTFFLISGVGNLKAF